MTYQKNSTPEPLAGNETMPPLPEPADQSYDNALPKAWTEDDMYEYARVYAEQAVAAEREACALVCESFYNPGGHGLWLDGVLKLLGNKIRARSKP